MLNAVSVASGNGLQFSLDHAASRPASSTSNFADHMLDIVKSAEVAAVDGVQGKVPVQEVVLKVMEAERTFATAMAIRDKAVAAYLEMSRMQI